MERLNWLQKLSLLIALSLIYSTNISYAQKVESPYQLHGWKDGIAIGLGVLGTAYGSKLIVDKEDISEEKLMDIISRQDDINGFDSWSIGNNSMKASETSDIPFIGSMFLPLLFLVDDDANNHFFQIFALYAESMAATGALYSISAGLSNRTRPYVYNESTPMGRRLNSNGQRSFYSGHVAVTATATFFTTRVYLDFHPDTKGKGFFWATAAALPALVGYYRIESGHHFLSDILVGYGLGAASGYFIPKWHLKEGKKVSLSPSMESTLFGDSFSTLALTYNF